MLKLITLTTHTPRASTIKQSMCCFLQPNCSLRIFLTGVICTVHNIPYLITKTCVTVPHDNNRRCAHGINGLQYSLCPRLCPSVSTSVTIKAWIVDHMLRPSTMCELHRCKTLSPYVHFPSARYASLPSVLARSRRELFCRQEHWRRPSVTSPNTPAAFPASVALMVARTHAPRHPATIDCQRVPMTAVATKSRRREPSDDGTGRRGGRTWGGERDRLIRRRHRGRHTVCQRRASGTRTSLAIGRLVSWGTARRIGV